MTISDSLSTAHEALEQWGHSLRKSVEHDNLNNRVVIYSKVQVLSTPEALSAAAATAIAGVPPNSAESTSLIGRYKFHGRIRDENSPHDFYPDPCNLTYAPDVKKAKEIMNCYTEYISPPGFTPQKFSYVRVEHRVGPDGAIDMQYGRCIEATPKSILSENEYSLKATCQSLSRLFEDALEVELFSIPGAAATIEDIKMAYPQIAAKGGFPEAIMLTATSLGIPDPGWLANLMNFETGGAFSSSTTNKNVPACKGLIQFCPGKKKENSGVVGIMRAYSSGLMKGLSEDVLEDRIEAVDRLSRLPEHQQMTYVGAYLKPYSGKLKTSIDLYMAVFQPAAIGRPDMKFSETIVKANPGVLSPRHYASKANKRSKLSTELASGIS